MRENGNWIGWGLGDNSTTDFTVRAFKHFARAMYHSYMGGLADTNLFDQPFYDSLCTMQDKLVAGGHLVVGQFRRGVLDLSTEYASGFKKANPKKHTIFTVNGFLGDMWTGYPAICGQAVTNAFWQPIGWTNNSIPMTQNIKDGVAELINQINLHRGTFLMAVYSEGAILGALVMDEIRNGSLQHRKNDFIGAIAFGNPRREQGSRPPGCPDPGGHGIARDRTVDTPSSWWDYSDPDDMYACTPNGPAGDNITACYQMIAQSNIIGGNTTLAKQILGLLTKPSLSNLSGLAGAIFKATKFYFSGTAGHVHYHDREIVPGTTYLNHAIGHLVERANAVAPR